MLFNLLITLDYKIKIIYYRPNILSSNQHEYKFSRTRGKSYPVLNQGTQEFATLFVYKFEKYKLYLLLFTALNLDN